jgi:hypothetical protein
VKQRRKERRRAKNEEKDLTQRAVEAQRTQRREGEKRKRR